MKIIIIGAGISGLTTYLFIKKLSSQSNIPLDIVIHEKHHAAPGHGSATVGGALGIAPNGLHVLRDLDEDLFLQVAALGYSISHFSMKNCYGRTLARFSAGDSANPPLHTLLIGRQLLWEVLRSKVPDGVVVNGHVAAIECGGSHSPRVIFRDESCVEADLIIGADGVRSIVKKAVTGDCREDDLPATFESLVGVGGFIPASLLSPDHPSGQLTLTFGAHGFFGYGPCSLPPPTNDPHYVPDKGPSEAVWWSTYQISHLPEKDNLNFVDIKRQLQERHGSWTDPVIKDIVANANLDSIHPTWTTPELPTWESKGIVLVGDAAHALQTSSGQGASQALEDAQTLSMLLVHYLDQCEEPDEAVRLATKRYVDIRKPRVKRIADRAKQMGDMKRRKGWLEEWIMYFFIWVMGLLGDSDGYNAFLMGDLPVNEVRKILRNENV